MKHLKDAKVFIEYSNDMNEAYKNINDYNPKKKLRTLIVFHDKIADIVSNKNLESLVTKK